jgi:hypothetical protein
MCLIGEDGKGKEEKIRIWDLRLINKFTMVQWKDVAFRVKTRFRSTFYHFLYVYCWASH